MNQHIHRLAALLTTEQITSYVQSSEVHFNRDVGDLDLKVVSVCPFPGEPKVLVLFTNVTIEGIEVFVQFSAEALSPGFDVRSYCTQQARATLTEALHHPEMLDDKMDHRFVPPQLWGKEEKC